MNNGVFPPCSTIVTTALLGLMCPSPGSTSPLDPPTVVTGDGTITSSGATLSGTVNPNGSDATAYFEYRLPGSSIYNSTTPVSVGSGTSAVPVTAAILFCSTPSTIQFRLVGQSSAGTTFGAYRVFQTPECVIPSATTGGATAIAATSATLNGAVSPHGVPAFAYFQYGTTTGYGSTSPTVAVGAIFTIPVSATVTSLSCGTVYHFRMVAFSFFGSANGADATFTTAACDPPLPPTVITGVASGIDRRVATLNGTATPNGTMTTGYFEYGLTTAYGSTTPVSSLGSGNVGVAIGNGSLSGLTCNTVYHFRAVATNSAGPASGLEAMFTTSKCWTAGDADGDAMADMTVFRASTGGWHTLKSSTAYSTSASYSWGLSTDTPVSGDYDGDGKSDPAIFRPSTGLWAILKSSADYGTSMYVSWGLSTDQPMPADYDGDGLTDPAVYRPSTGGWYVLKSSTSYTTSVGVSWGLSTDVPLPGDFDGDGKADPAVYRPSTGGWYVLKSSTGYTTSSGVSWGLSTDVPVPGDYDGDGKIDPAVFRSSTGGWYVLKSSTSYTSSFGVSWGLSTDIPVPGDFDGDGKIDPAVFRPSTGSWYVLKSITNYASSSGVSWGLSTDVPILERPWP